MNTPDLVTPDRTFLAGEGSGTHRLLATLARSPLPAYARNVSRGCPVRPD